MSFVNTGPLSSPPVDGIVYNQAGILGVAAVSMGVLVLDLTMQVLLIDKKAATRYISKSSESKNEDSVETQDAGRRTSKSHRKKPALGRCGHIARFLHSTDTK
jgi:hypothetical protein